MQEERGAMRRVPFEVPDEFLDVQLVLASRRECHHGEEELLEQLLLVLGCIEHPFRQLWELLRDFLVGVAQVLDKFVAGLVVAEGRVSVQGSCGRRSAGGRGRECRRVSGCFRRFCG